jgi:membrane protease subunit HflK
MKDSEIDRKSIAALISVGINVFLALLKALLAIFSGSLALLADAYHSGSDIFVSLLVFLGIKVPKRDTIAPSRRASIENIISVVISLFILYAAYTVFKTAAVGQRIAIRILPVAIFGTFLSIIITYFLARYKIYVGKATNSPSLIADGYHSRADMYSSIAVLIGLVGYLIGLLIDALAAIVVALFIVFTGIEILQSGVRALVGKRSPQLIPFKHRRLPLLHKWKVFYEKIAMQRWVILKIAGLCLILGYMVTGLYIVRPGEQAVVQRFGKITKGRVMPGLHYHLPHPFEKVSRVSTIRVNRVEIGFRTREKIEKEPEAYLWEIRHIIGRYDKRYEEALMLTGDRNIIDMSIVIQYRIRDIANYLFKIDIPIKVLRAATESTIRKIVASERIDVLLSEDRAAIEKRINRDLQALLNEYGIGIEVLGVAIQELHPPIEVVPAFRSVATAREDKERYINEAESELNQIVPRARADAKRIMEEAESYKIASINQAKGEADRFLKRLARYKEASSVTASRYYLETMEKTLPKVNKFILAPGSSKDILDLRPYIKGSIEALTGGEQK